MNKIIDFKTGKPIKKSASQGDSQDHRIVYPGIDEATPEIAFKVRLELVQPIDSDLADYDFDFYNRPEAAPIFKAGKAEKSISREIIVSPHTSLHELKYIIQALFGWEDTVPQIFTVPKAKFREMTDNENFAAWAELCGYLFRFPCEPYLGDAFWNVDNKDFDNLKSWYRKQYTTPTVNLCVSDAYLPNVVHRSAFAEWYLATHPDETWDTLLTKRLAQLKEETFLRRSFNSLCHRLTLQELLVSDAYRLPCHAEWIGRMMQQLDHFQVHLEDMCSDPEVNAHFEEMQQGALNLAMLRERRIFILALLKSDPQRLRKELNGRNPHATLAEITQQIRELELLTLQFLEEGPVIEPNFDTLYYSYGMKNEWLVKITVSDSYTAVPMPNSGKASDILTFLDNPYGCLRQNGERVDAETAELVKKAYEHHHPTCVAADGIKPWDIQTGLAGYADFLDHCAWDKTEEFKELRENVKNAHGWTGRKVMPKRML